MFLSELFHFPWKFPAVQTRNFCPVEIAPFVLKILIFMSRRITIYVFKLELQACSLCNIDSMWVAIHEDAVRVESANSEL